MKNVLFIGAHPDDVELGCGGTIIKHIKEGDNVFILILSRGENGQNGRKINRVNESIKGLCSAGVKKSNIKVLNIPDTDFPKERKKIFIAIEKLCKFKKIDRVYTHTKKEYHQDHIVANEETLRAARNVLDILTYESNAHTYADFSPNFFVDIADVIDKKLSLLSFFKSQLDKDYLEVQNIKSLAKMRGYQGKNEYAEGFEIIRMVSK